MPRSAAADASGVATGDGGPSRRYVYGIVPSADPPAIASPGIGEAGPEVRVVSHGDVAALVSAFAGDVVKANRRNLMAHSDVLQEALRTSTVLPMRFGVLMPSDEVVVEELLRARRAELRRLLDGVAGRVELSVKAFYREDVVLREVVRDDPAIARLSQATRGVPEAATYYERLRLGELVAAAVRAKRERDAAEILARLGGLAVATTVEEELPERMALKAAFLVERERVPEFDRAVGEVARETADRMQFKYVGPLPPHTFATLALPARAANPA